MILAVAAVRLPPSSFTGLLLLLLVTQVRQAQCATYDIGEYLKVSTVGAGTLTSPNYPSEYSDRDHAIWLLEAPNGQAVRLDISPVSGQGEGDVGHVNITGCKDYLEVRDGNAQGVLHFLACNTNETVTVVSSNRWLWVKFFSDDNVTSTGFTANFFLNDSSADPGENPWADCQTPRWSCRNRECISQAYRCDGLNDCGCTGSTCDEADCGGINWSMEWKVAVGVSIGTVIFTGAFLGVGYLDYWLKKKQEAENKRIEDLENSRGRRRPKAPALSMVVPAVASTANQDPAAPVDRRGTITTIKEHDDSKGS